MYTITSSHSAHHFHFVSVPSLYNLSEESKPPSVLSSIRLKRHYPGNTAGRCQQFLADPVQACTHGVSPFHPQYVTSAYPASQHYHIMVSFLCQSQNSRPTPFRRPCVRKWRDFPHDTDVAAAALPLSSHGIVRRCYYVFCMNSGMLTLALDVNAPFRFEGGYPPNKRRHHLNLYHPPFSHPRSDNS